MHCRIYFYAFQVNIYKKNNSSYFKSISCFFFKLEVWEVDQICSYAQLHVFPKYDWKSANDKWNISVWEYTDLFP